MAGSSEEDEGPRKKRGQNQVQKLTQEDKMWREPLCWSRRVRSPEPLKCWFPRGIDQYSPETRVEMENKHPDVEVHPSQMRRI